MGPGLGVRSRGPEGYYDGNICAFQKVRVVSIVFDVVTPYEEDRVEDLGFRGLPRLIKDFGLAALGFTYTPSGETCRR